VWEIGELFCVKSHVIARFPARGTRFRFWDPPRPLFSAFQDSFPAGKACGAWSWPHHFVPRLRMGGAISPLPLYAVVAWTIEMCTTVDLAQDFKWLIIYACHNIFYQCAFVDPLRKVKESRNRPGVAQRVPGGLGSQISMTFGTRRWRGRQPLHPGMFLVLTFTRDCVDPRAMMRSLKSPATPPGIDPGTVRLVAQRLNHYATPGPGPLRTSVNIPYRTY